MQEQRECIQTVQEFTCKVRNQLEKWETSCTPWFRGDSDVSGQKQLLPRIFTLTAECADEFKAAVAENYLVQSFRRKAGGFKDTPPAGRTDLWLFLAQHYNVPTRLLDWTESALNALFFAINRGNPNPTVYMLNPRQLNRCAFAELLELALEFPRLYAEKTGYLLLDKKGDPISDSVCLEKCRPDLVADMKEQAKSYVKMLECDTLNYPLTLVGDGDRKPGYVNIAPAWEYRASGGIKTPMAFPATHQDTRMIAQRSCFTCHGSRHEPLDEIVENDPEIIVPFHIHPDFKESILGDLMVLGTSQASIFPDLDSVGRDLAAEVRLKFGKIKPSKKRG